MMNTVCQCSIQELSVEVIIEYNVIIYLESFSEF